MMSSGKNDNVYYCAFCETSHTFQREGGKCPTCGRQYCVQSINSALEAGRESCPYCEKTQFKYFPLIFPLQFESIPNTLSC